MVNPFDAMGANIFLRLCGSVPLYTDLGFYTSNLAMLLNAIYTLPSNSEVSREEHVLSADLFMHWRPKFITDQGDETTC